MAQAFGAKLHILNIEWGQAVTVQQIEKQLLLYPNLKVVMTQACETSTAVIHPIREIAALLRDHPQILFLVDGITAVGAMPIEMDAWGIDGLVAGSQKAFMLPTGLSFVSLSKKAWAVCEKVTTPRFYFDLRAEKKANDKGETFFSSVVPTIRALDWVLQDVQKQGLPHFYSRILRRARMTHEFARLAGLQLFAQSPSPSVTALMVPAGVDSQKIRGQLEKDFQITIMGGQDQAKGKILRIGHMGYIEDSQMLTLFARICELLKLPSVQEPLQKWLKDNP